MKVLLDVSHPAHVHFFKPIGRELIERGHGVLLALRAKDNAAVLAAASGLPLASPPANRWSGHRPGGGLVQRGMELGARVRWLRSVIREEDVNLLMTRNPSGVLAGRAVGIPTIFDSDDGASAKLHFALGKPFATIVTTPELLGADLGSRHRKYHGLKSSVFLSPQRFTVDQAVREHYGVDSRVPLFTARFSANDSSHDRNVRSMPEQFVAAIREALESKGALVLSIEGQGTVLSLPRVDGISRTIVTVEPSDFLHLLGNSELFVGDTGSVAMEAVALGVPALSISDLSRPILRALEKDHGVVENFTWAEQDGFRARLDEWLHDKGLHEGHATRSARLLASFDDLVPWFADLAESLLYSREAPAGRRAP